MSYSKFNGNPLSLWSLGFPQNFCGTNEENARMGRNQSTRMLYTHPLVRTVWTQLIFIIEGAVVFVVFLSMRNE